MRGGGLLLGVQATELVTGLITAFVLTNFTSPQTYATFGYVVALLAVASLAALPGVDAAVVRAATRGEDGALAYGTRKRWKASMLGAVGMLIWAGALFQAGREAEALAVAGCSALVPLLYPSSTVLAFLQGKKRFLEYTRAVVAVEIAKSAAVVAAVLLLAWDGTPVVLIPFVVMSAGYWMLNRRHRTGDAPGPDFDRIARLLTGAAALGVVAAQLDRLVIGTFFAPATMAAYTLGFTLTSPLRSLGSLLAKLLVPRILDANATAAVFRRRYGVGLAALAVALGAIVAIYWLAFPLIQPLVFPGYAESAAIVRWLSVAMALSAFDLVAVQALWGLPRLRALYVTQWLFPIQRVVFVSLAAWWGGVAGILAAQIAHYLLCAVVILVLWLRASRPHG